MATKRSSSCHRGCDVCSRTPRINAEVISSIGTQEAKPIDTAEKPAASELLVDQAPEQMPILLPSAVVEEKRGRPKNRVQHNGIDQKQSGLDPKHLYVHEMIVRSCSRSSRQSSAHAGIHLLDTEGQYTHDSGWRSPKPEASPVRPAYSRYDSHSYEEQKHADMLKWLSATSTRKE